MTSNILNRESIMNEHHIQILSIPLLAMRGYLCFRCFRPAKLTKCGGCKRVVYCGKDCQVLDWKIRHKKDCKILQRINKFEVQETAPSRSRELWTESMHFKIQLIQDMTKDATPRDIIQCQPYCRTCHRGAMQIKPPTILKPCATCHLVFTCTSCTASHSVEECQLFEKIGNIEISRIKHFEETRQVAGRIPTETPRSSYRPLSTAVNWFEYFTEISDKKATFGRFLKPDLSLNTVALNSLPDKSRQDMMKDLYSSILTGTEVLSMPLTILAALEESMRDLATRANLNIFVVGARSKELQNSWVFEELFHLLPSLKTIKTMFIGPDSKVVTPYQNGSEIKMECCPNCSSRGRKRVVALYEATYHDYAQTAHYQKPDLAVLFHSGRSQAGEASWKPTTKYLVDSATLTLCTTYTEREAREETEELEALGARFIRRPEENRWKSLVPIPEFLEGPDDGMFYHNYYRYIFQGK